MEQIKNKFIHFKTENKFKEALIGGGITDKHIVFIKDIRKIYTHGQYYNCDLTDEQIQKIDKIVVDGSGTKFLSDNGSYIEISSSQTSIQDAPDGNYYVRKKGEWARINIPEVQQDIAFFDINYSGYLPTDGYSKNLTSDQFEKIKQAVIDKKIIRINAVYGTLFGFANTYYSDITATQYINIWIRSLEDATKGSVNINEDSKVDLSDFSVKISTTQNEDGTYTFTIRKSDYKIPEAPKDGRTYLRKDGKWVDPVTNIIKIHQSKGIITGDINGPVIQWIRKNSHRVLAKNITNEGDLIPKMAYIELDDTNSNKYHDGTDAKTDGTEGDVFVKLPTFYYSGVTLNGDDGTEGDILEIKFSREYFDGCVEWNTNLLVGAYAYVRPENNDKAIRSVSRSGGVSNGIKISELHNRIISGCGRQKQGFFGITWNIRSIINCLFYAMYGTMDFISKCGKGVSYTIVGQIGAGSSNTLGMKDTTPEDIVGKISVNFWGFEDWCGNYCEIFSDIWDYKKIDDTNHEITLYPVNMYISGYDEEMKFNINGNLGESIVFIKNMEINKSLNLFPTKIENLFNNIFRSRIEIKQPDEDGQIFVYKGITGGSGRTDDDYQLFSFGSELGIFSGGVYSTRLIFIGDCIKYQNSTIFKSIPLVV